MIFEKNLNSAFLFDKSKSIFAPAFQQSGVLAQLVEQWTENPCVPGSIPGDTTKGVKPKPRTLIINDYQRSFFMPYTPNYIPFMRLRRIKYHSSQRSKLKNDTFLLLLQAFLGRNRVRIRLDL